MGSRACRGTAPHPRRPSSAPAQGCQAWLHSPTPWKGLPGPRAVAAAPPGACTHATPTPRCRRLPWEIALWVTGLAAGSPYCGRQRGLGTGTRSQAGHHTSVDAGGQNAPKHMAEASCGPRGWPRALPGRPPLRVQGTCGFPTIRSGGLHLYF